MTQDHLQSAIDSSVSTQVNVGVLVGLSIGGAALCIVGVLLVVMAVNGALKWQAGEDEGAGGAGGKEGGDGEEEHGG